MKIVRQYLIWLIKIAGLTILYIPIWIAGAMFIQDGLPDVKPEPGLVSDTTGMLFLALVNTLLIISLIVTSKWRGWKLALVLAVAYYGSFTFITQIETWYFLSGITVSSELISALFLMGLTVPLLFIPIAILISGYWKDEGTVSDLKLLDMPVKQFLIRLTVIAILYVIIYWIAGYYIAWQNPELRSFYGSQGEIMPFWDHTIQTLSDTPDLLILQLFRGTLFALFVYPVIRGSSVSPWITALIIGSLLAIPSLGHIIANPLIPSAEVRFTHMIETIPSTFLFGVIITLIFHRKFTTKSCEISN